MTFLTSLTSPKGDVRDVWRCQRCLEMSEMFGDVRDVWRCQRCLEMLEMFGDVRRFVRGLFEI